MTVDLFSDLDNTLIYSHRVPLSQDKIAAEMLNGREQSYMTRQTFQFLKNSPSIRLIPVTTRSKEQFHRIFLFHDSIPCPYALVCNGGELLINGESDPQWLEETKKNLSRELDALAGVIEIMRTAVPSEHIHTPSGLMVYAVSDNPAEIAKKLRTEIKSGFLAVYYDRRKVYCFPTAMNKGAAVSRFKAQYPTELMVTAGDSVFDLSLLNAGDFAVTVRSLADDLDSKRKIIIIEDDTVLSDGLCAFLGKLLNAKQRGK